MKPLHWILLSPLALLLWGIISVLFFDVTPIASGYGWDGVLYGKMTLDFEGMIGNITPYRAGRIFPSVLVYYSYKLFSIPLTLQSVLIGYRIYAVLVLVFSGILWVRISRHLKLKPIAFWVGFFALFINPSLFNFNFYFPVSTDSTAFLLSLCMVYFYTKSVRYALLPLIALSAFTFPVSSLIGAVLFISPQVSLTDPQHTENTGRWTMSIILVLPILLGYAFNAGEGPIKLFIVNYLQFIPINNPNNIASFSYYTLVIDLLASVYLFVLISYVLKRIHFVKTIKLNLSKKVVLRSAIVIVMLLAFSAVIKALSDPTIHAFGLKRFVLRITSMDTYKYPLQFIVTHFSYYGFSIGLLLLFFKRFIQYLRKNDFPVFLVVLMFLVLSIATESRALINFYPFIVIYLIRSIDFDFVKNKKIFLGTLLGLSLLYSKIWFPIRLPSTTFPNTVDVGLDRFPMQGFFMNMGPWINLEMFIVHTVAGVLVFYLLYRMVRR